MRGFEDELKSNGRSAELVLRHGEAPVGYDHGASVTPKLLEKRVDAVFAVSDLSAVGIVMECQRRGVAVPGQLSVVGFGDFEIGREINPPLTTIHVDFRALGQRTADLILDLLRTASPAAPQLVDVGLTLVERASVRGPA